MIQVLGIGDKDCPRVTAFSLFRGLFRQAAAISPSVSDRYAVLRRATLSQGAMDLGQQQLAHLVARRLVEPVQKPSASGRLAEALIDLEAHAGEELLDFGDRFQSLALPTAEAQRARRLDRPILHALQRRRRGRRALNQARVVVG